MSRKNIFEIVADSFDLPKELARMKRLFEKEKLVRIDFVGDYTVLDYIQAEGFSYWKNRGRCVDANDFLQQLGYQSLWVAAMSDIQDLLLLIEIIYNFWHIVARQTHMQCRQELCGRNFILLKTIMDDCLAHYNYKGEYFFEQEKLIVIEDKPEATAVAEIVDTEIAHKVLRYNHYLLKGDLDTKKEILLAIGTDLEPMREQIKSVDKNLEDGIFYLLNNLHLRHNNKAESDKKYRKVIAEMDSSVLENWYDELYQMMLLAYLLLDQAQRNDRIKALKRTVTPK